MARGPEDQNDKTKQLHDLEQGLAMMADNFPPMWYRLYRNCIQQGFNENQAFQILVTQVHGAAGGRLSM